MSTSPTNSDCRSAALALHTDLATINTYADKSPAVTLALLIEAERKLLKIGHYIGEVRQAALDMRRAQAEIDIGGWDKIEAGTDQAA